MAAAPSDAPQPADAPVAERGASDARGPNFGRQRNLQQGRCGIGTIGSSCVSQSSISSLQASGRSRTALLHFEGGGMARDRAEPGGSRARSGRVGQTGRDEMKGHGGTDRSGRHRTVARGQCNGPVTIGYCADTPGLTFALDEKPLAMLRHQVVQVDTKERSHGRRRRQRHRAQHSLMDLHRGGRRWCLASWTFVHSAAIHAEVPGRRGERRYHPPCSGLISSLYAHSRMSLRPQGLATLKR
jgi:hypothetical protein